MPRWLLRFDGLYEPRYTTYGVATYGFTVDHGDERVHEGHGVVVGPGEGGSANVAEFGALLHGLTWLVDNAAESVRSCGLHVEGDNKLAIETVAGRWNLHGNLVPVRDRAQALVEELGGLQRVTFEKVSRERNAQADALTRLAYKEAKEAHPDWPIGKGSRALAAKWREAQAKPAAPAKPKAARKSASTPAKPTAKRATKRAGKAR